MAKKKGVEEAEGSASAEAPKDAKKETVKNEETFEDEMACKAGHLVLERIRVQTGRENVRAVLTRDGETSCIKIEALR